MEPYLITCPYCETEWIVHPDDELCHSDGDTTTCDECGEEYILTAKTEVFFDAYKVPLHELDDQLDWEENQHG